MANVQKSWAKLPTKSMTNGTCGGAKNNGIFNYHKTFRCVDLVCNRVSVYNGPSMSSDGRRSLNDEHE